MNLFIRSIIVIALFIFGTTYANAATLSFSPQTSEINIGQEVTLTLQLDTEEVPVNATQATITFPKNLLKVTSVNFAKSVFNFWVEEPTFSNEDGTLRLIGGTAKGLSGGSLGVVSVTFESISSGEATIGIQNAVVTASDGRGTNVLSRVEQAVIGIGVEVVTPESTFNPAEIIVPEPEVITRAALQASELPIAPVVHVPLYPDPEKWYNHSGEVVALWDVPVDIQNVSIGAQALPGDDIHTVHEELINGNNFGIFEEGITYLHVQFENNVGWGPHTHYRIAIDTKSPLPFELSVEPNASENPSPTLIFDTQDELSGISHATIQVDGGELYRSTSTTFMLPLQRPGAHTVTVRVFDMAGNSIEDTTSFEILPLPKPTITYIPGSISQDDRAFLSGRGTPGAFVDTAVFDRRDNIAFVGTSEVDNLGNWSVVVNQLLPTGVYSVTATLRNERGATSYPTDPEEFRVRPKTIFAIGPVELGWFEITLIILLLIVLSGSFITWRYMEQQQRQSAYSTVAVRDVKKLASLIEEDADELAKHIKKNEKKMTKQSYGEAEHLLKKIRVTTGNMKTYIADQIEKIR